MGVQTQHLVVAMAGVEQAVFDHAGGRAHQGEGVRVVPAVVARDVDDATQTPFRGEHRRGGTGQKAVAGQVVLGAMDDDGALLGQGGADGIGAPVVLMPECAGAQGDPLGPGGEVGVAQAVEQQALAVGQHDDVAAVAHLVEDKAHDRAGVGEQVVFAGQGVAQVGGAAQGRLGGHIDRAEAGVAAAQPGLPQCVVHQAQGHIASIHQAAASLLEVGCRLVVGQLEGHGG